MLYCFTGNHQGGYPASARQVLRKMILNIVPQAQPGVRRREIMKKNQPSKYGILNNSLFMAGTAWKNVPSVLYLTLAQALLAVGLSVV